MSLNGAKKAKKCYGYATKELAMLELHYQNSKYINGLDLQKLAERLNVKGTRVINWFSKRRVREKTGNQSELQPKKKKNWRARFTFEEVAILEDCYKDSKYIYGLDLQKLAERLNVKGTRVINWFSKRRAKEKTGNQSESQPKKKINRRARFTFEEVAILEDYYKDSKYIYGLDLQKLAERLNVGSERIFNWFQYQRIKTKKEYKENMYEFSPASLSSYASTPSPAQFQSNPSAEQKINSNAIRDNLMQYRNCQFESIHKPFIPQEPTILYQPYYSTHSMPSMDMYAVNGHQLNVSEMSSVDIRHEHKQQELQNVPYSGFNENRYHPTGTSTDIIKYWRPFNCE